jgi:hypothetical protein
MEKLLSLLPGYSPSATSALAPYSGRYLYHTHREIGEDLMDDVIRVAAGGSVGQLFEGKYCIE